MESIAKRLVAILTSALNSRNKIFLDWVQSVKTAKLVSQNSLL